MRMTKAQARKRLDEAQIKIMKVYGFCDHLSTKDFNELIRIVNAIRPIKNRLK